MKINLLIILTACLPVLAQSPAEHLQKGFFEEEVNRNLEAAIGHYQAILEAATEQRRIAATALFRLAESHRKLGRTNEATELFTRLAREYPEQEGLISRIPRPLSLATNAPGASSAWTFNARQIAQRVFDAGRLEVTVNALSNLTDIEKRSVLPVVISSLELERLAKQHIAEEARLHALSVDHGEEHPDVLSSRSVLQLIHRQIDHAAAREISTMNFTLASIRTFLQSFKPADLQQLPAELRQAALQAELNEILAAEQRIRGEATLLQLKLESLLKSPPASHPVMIPSVYPTPLLEFLREKMAELQRDLTSKLHDFGDEHSEILKLRRMLTAYHEELGNHLKGVLKGLEIRVKTVEAGLAALRDLAQKRTAEFKQASELQVGTAATSPVQDLARKLEDSPDLLEAVFGTGLTRLQTAAKDGDLEMLQFLLSRGASVDKYTRQSSTPLYLAVQSGHLRAAELLIEAGADVNAAPHNRTPLHEAASRGYKNLMELLIAKGADVNAAPLSGNTPLHAAVSGRQPEAVALLLEHGADANLYTPLTTAIRNREFHDTAVIKALLKGGADPNRPGYFGPVFYALPYPDLLEILLANGGNASVTNEMGETPLFYSVKHHFNIPNFELKNGPFLESTRLLLAKRSDPNARDQRGYTPMLHALSSPEALELLLESGGDPNTADGEGKTLLDWARQIPGSLELLFKHGAKTTPLTDAAAPKQPSVETKNVPPHLSGHSLKN